MALLDSTEPRIRPIQPAARESLVLQNEPVGRTLARPAGRATVKRRYYRWVENGALDRLFEAVSRESDLEWLMIDACVYRKFDSA